MSRIMKLLSLAVFMMFFVKSGISYGYGIDLDNRLLNLFPSIDKSYTQVRFNNGGNDFGGVFFRLGSKVATDENSLYEVKLGGTNETLECRKQIYGLYYNPQRGNKLRPLDTRSLTRLKSTFTTGGYAGLVMTGGFFAGCDGEDDPYIYGQISHSYSGLIFKMVAGVQYTGNGYTQKFAQNFELIDEVGTGRFFDSRGGIGMSYGTGVPDMVVDSFSFAMVKNADLDTVYTSDPLTVEGLGDNMKVLAKIGDGAKGVLFINGKMSGTSGYVKNGDDIEIELMSSKDYDTITSSIVYLGEKYGTFYIMTKSDGYSDNGDVLSLTQRLKIMATFNAMIKVYESDSEKLKTFLYTFKSMISDQIDSIEEDSLEKEALQYMLDLIEAKLLDVTDGSNGGTIDGDLYIAPNCKRYPLEYDEERQAHYSSSFVKIHYFVTKEALKKYVDERNKGNGTCSNTSTVNDPNIRVAPNGKVYKIVQTNQGYTSYDFAGKAKVFSTLGALHNYIDMSNPEIITRDHTIDATFTPVSHTAPNGKVYEIKKTDKGYMSYNLLIPKYFTSIGDIELYIDQKNPAKK